MATNPYFNHHGKNTADQRLAENLMIESIKTYGIDVNYCPRTLVKEDLLLGEDALSEYNSAHTIEMYIKTIDGFEGEGDFVAKFGLQINDQITFTVARRRWAELGLVGDGRETAPKEGDIIYFPLTNALFQVLFVEDESVFYQTGGLQVYDLVCEMFTYSDQKLNTGIEDIDKIERLQAYSLDFTMDTGSGDYTVEEIVYQGESLEAATVQGEVASWGSTTKILNLINMTGNFSGTVNIIGDSSGASYSVTSFNAQDSTSASAGDNLAIEQEADSIIDFTEGNPFGSL
jgi:hypothetical protein